MARLLYLGRLREAAGRGGETLTLPGNVSSAADLIAHLAARDPGLGAALSSASVRVAVNQKIGAADAVLCDTDEIAFLPPMSGG